jgi:hypothetical protein
MSMNWLSTLPAAGCVLFRQNGERTRFLRFFAVKSLTQRRSDGPFGLARRYGRRKEVYRQAGVTKVTTSIRLPSRSRMNAP